VSAPSGGAGSPELPGAAAGNRLRFPTSVRLRRTGEFARLKHEGVSFHGKFMVLSVLKIPSQLSARIGLITSRRVGGAVVRNRVRRRMRELVRADRLRLAPAFWLVLIARQRAAGADFEQLRREWRTLAFRAGLLPEQP
jgi:ribonuclease P protein component